MTRFKIAAKASFQNPALFLPNFSIHLRLISAKWKIICGAMWAPPGRIINRYIFAPGHLQACPSPRHGRMLGLWVLQPGLIARDQHRSTGGQANADGFLYSPSLQSRAVSEPSLSPSQILRGSGSLPLSDSWPLPHASLHLPALSCSDTGDENGGRVNRIQTGIRFP